MGGRGPEGRAGRQEKTPNVSRERRRGERRARRRHEEGKRDIKQSVGERDGDCAHCVGNNASHTAKRLAPQPQATATITI